MFRVNVYIVCHTPMNVPQGLLLLRNQTLMPVNDLHAYDPGFLKHGRPISCHSPAGAHEAAHRFVAKQTGDQLSLPLFFPSPLGTLGSFGGITRIKAPAANR